MDSLNARRISRFSHHRGIKCDPSFQLVVLEVTFPKCVEKNSTFRDWRMCRPKHVKHTTRVNSRRSLTF